MSATQRIQPTLEEGMCGFMVVMVVLCVAQDGDGGVLHTLKALIIKSVQTLGLCCQARNREGPIDP